MSHLLFQQLNVSPELKRAIAAMGFEEATPIQSQSIPPILQGRDVVAQAPTGTGKTCAFGIPLIEGISPDSRVVEGLILCPTRELAIQITEELQKLCKFKRGVRVVTVYGGQPIDRQITALKKRPQIIVATPGRLMDHMRRKTIKLQTLKCLVLDEADEMLNMGFREDIDTILQSAPAERQTLLFSATLSPEILDITKEYQTNAEMIRLVHKQVTVPTVEQYYVEVKENAKLDALTRLVDEKNYKLSIVFCNTKRMVDRLKSDLAARGYRAEALHGDVKQTQRDRVMARFRKGSVDILVATDVAARGIDVDDVEAVFNYDIPNDLEYYVHRIGRTGRANKTGVAYTFATSRQMYQLKEIMRYTKSTIAPLRAPSPSDLAEAKLKQVFRQVAETVGKNGLQRYVEAIERFLEEDERELTTLDVAAALLKQTVTLDSPSHKSQKEGQLAQPPKDEPFTRLFLNIGTLDKIHNRNIFDLFKANTQIDVRVIQDITLFDKYSFVTIPSEFVQQAIDGLNGADFKGRTLSVEVANPKGAKTKRSQPRKAAKRPPAQPPMPPSFRNIRTRKRG